MELRGILIMLLIGLVAGWLASFIVGGGGEDITGLTCHQADWHQMGRMAVQVVQRALENPKTATAEHCLCPHELRLGQTTVG